MPQIFIVVSMEQSQSLIPVKYVGTEAQSSWYLLPVFLVFDMIEKYNRLH